MREFMTLKVLLPFAELVSEEQVSSLTVMSGAGSLGILPNRMDFTAVVKPGIVKYSVRAREPRYLATGEGLVVKCGGDVRLIVHDGISGPELGQLKSALISLVRDQDEQAQEMRRMIRRLEVELAKGFGRNQP